MKLAQETLQVGIVVREMRDGQRFYDHFIVGKSDPAGTSGAATDANRKLGVQPSAGSGESLSEDSPEGEAPAARRGAARAGADADRRHADVENLVARITGAWANAPKVIVVRDLADEQVPAAVRAEDESQRASSKRCGGQARRRSRRRVVGPHVSAP